MTFIFVFALGAVCGAIGMVVRNAIAQRKTLSLLDKTIESARKGLEFSRRR